VRGVAVPENALKWANFDHDDVAATMVLAVAAVTMLLLIIIIAFTHHRLY